MVKVTSRKIISVWLKIPLQAEQNNILWASQVHPWHQVASLLIALLFQVPGLTSALEIRSMMFCWCWIFSKRAWGIKNVGLKLVDHLLTENMGLLNTFDYFFLERDAASKSCLVHAKLNSSTHPSATYMGILYGFVTGFLPSPHTLHHGIEGATKITFAHPGWFHWVPRPQSSQLFSRLGHSATAWTVDPQPGAMGLAGAILVSKEIFLLTISLPL